MQPSAENTAKIAFVAQMRTFDHEDLMLVARQAARQLKTQGHVETTMVIRDLEAFALGDDTERAETFWNLVPLMDVICPNSQTPSGTLTVNAIWNFLLRQYQTQLSAASPKSGPIFSKPSAAQPRRTRRPRRFRRGSRSSGGWFDDDDLSDLIGDAIVGLFSLFGKLFE